MKGIFKRLSASPHKSVMYSVVSHYVKFDKMKKGGKSKKGENATDKTTV